MTNQRTKRKPNQPNTTEETPTAAQRAPRVPLKRVLALLRPYSGRLVIAAILLVITTSLGLVFPLVIRSLLNTILVQHDEHLLNLIVEGLLILFVLQALIGAVQGYLVTALGERLSFDLRTRLFRHLQMLPLSFFDHRRTGELMSRVTNDVTLLQTSLTSNVLPIASQVVMLVGSIAIVALINWRITLVALIVTPVAVLTIGLLGRRIRQTTRGVQEGLGDAGTVLEEALSAPRVVKAFTREDYETERFTTRMRGSLRAALRRAVAQAMLGPLSGFVGFTAVLIVIWFGGREVLAGRLTAGDLVAFIFYLFLIISPLISLSNLYSQIQAALAAAERVFELLDEPVEPALTTASAAPLPPLPPLTGHIAFDHVSFAYPADPNHSASDSAPAQASPPSQPRPAVLRNVTFAAMPGQVVAIVGPSGAGKTTMLSLLLRLYELDAGAIRVDDTDIRNVQVRSLREQMAVVPQEPAIFGDSIAENIRYGRLDASDEQVRAAAAAANALAFIEQLPDGMRTIVGERGVKLSAGQRQRIAIARALLHDPRILLLDEATAALDNESEALVQDALNHLMRGRTTLVVAHRLTTIERADLILVLNDGAIVERGTHTELLAREGLYARLYTRNFEDLDSTPSVGASGGRPSSAMQNAIVTVHESLSSG
ncbi:MAG: Lipid A export ATP-binding/permease protein MsbA [Ktedonobacterales bacterium]|nr:MAG: Lipid A export ATP-binding/permease protein MsbA [Ktedonobacterales bacterium]